MPAPPGYLETLVSVVQASGIDLRGWALAWARMGPSLALVPAFGLRAIPAPARAALGLTLAASAAPALGPISSGGLAWPVALGIETAKGLPVALSASVALWTANMAGGLVDNLRGSRESGALPVVEPGSTPTGTLFALLVSIAFLEMGGAEHVAQLIADPNLQFKTPLIAAVAQLSHGIELAVLVSAPVLAASIVLEVASALVVRAASPASLQGVIAPLRSVVLLALVAILLDRMLELLVRIAGR